MHRIRHFKINGRMVWDRASKLDILSGSEQQNEISDGMNEIFSFYFRLSIRRERRMKIS